MVLSHYFSDIKEFGFLIAESMFSTESGHVGPSFLFALVFVKLS